MAYAAFQACSLFTELTYTDTAKVVRLGKLQGLPPQYRGQISLLEGVEHDSGIKSGELSSAWHPQPCGLLTSIGQIETH